MSPGKRVPTVERDSRGPAGKRCSVKQCRYGRSTGSERSPSRTVSCVPFACSRDQRTIRRVARRGLRALRAGRLLTTLAQFEGVNIRLPKRFYPRTLLGERSRENRPQQTQTKVLESETYQRRSETVRRCETSRKYETRVCGLTCARSDSLVI